MVVSKKTKFPSDTAFPPPPHHPGSLSMKFLKAAFLITLTGVLAIAGIMVARFASPPAPASYTTNLWSIVQDQIPRKDLVVLEETVVETIREHWRASPPLWRIPLGDWPGEAIIRIDAPATILWSVPLDADWKYAVEGSELVIRPPALELLAIDIDSSGIQSVYEKTAARWNEHEIERKIRTSMRSHIANNAENRRSQIYGKADESILAFFDEYILRHAPDIDPALPRRIVWTTPDKSLASNPHP